MNAGPWIDDEDDGFWVRGGDYLTGWRDAEAAALAFNRAILRAGCDAELIRATPHVGPRGEGVVWLSPAAVEMVAQVLEGVACGNKRSA